MKKARIIFLCVGIILLGLLFAVFGVKEPVRQIVDFGWKFWLCVVIYLFNQLLLSYGWMVLIPCKLKARNYIDVLFARIAGDSTTTINSAAGVAGDALKALYLKDIVPFKKGFASVVLDRMLHTVGNTLLVVFGIIAAFFKLNLPSWTLILLLAVVLCFLLLMVFLIKNHSRGFIQYIVSKMPGFLKKKILTKERKPKIVQLDDEIKMVFSYKKNLRHVYVSLFMHTIPVLLSGTLEVYVIMYFINGSVTFFDAMLVYIFGLFIASIAFFVPLNIGTSEGSYAIALRLLGYNPQLGIAIGMLRRIRALVWSLPGLFLLFHKGLTGGKKDISEKETSDKKSAVIKKKSKKS
jgi:uncharacterized protein (TIRG00374 family)